MNLFLLFIRRRFWLVRRQWFGEIITLFLITLLSYLSFGLTFEQQFEGVLQGYLYHSWVIPGILFVVIIIISGMSIFTNITRSQYSRGLNLHVVSSPHSILSLFTSFVMSLFPELVIKTLLSGWMIILIAGVYFNINIFHFIGLLIFALILGFFCINVFLTILMSSRSTLSSTSWIIGISLFFIFTSGWIIPVQSFPQSIENIFSYFPTTLLGEGGRKVYLTGEIRWVTGLVPLVISGCWFFVNSAIFKKVAFR